MKQKKVLFKKFHRKYVFLQNSLVNFLDWRVSEFSNLMTVTTSNNKQTKSFSLINKKKNKFHFLEQEKICFQEYWKSSEQKKLENAIHNMNKEFIMSNNNFDYSNSFIPSKKRKVFNRVGIKPFDSGAIKQSLYSKNQQQLSSKKQNFLQPLQKKSFIVFEKTKSLKINNNFKLFSFQKKFKNLKNSQFLSPNTLETFIPKSDCFQKRNRFFVNQKFDSSANFGGATTLPFKLGEFFPKKKNFHQYWIFLLLGFIVFFSSTPSFFDRKFKQIFNNDVVATMPSELEKSLPLSPNALMLNCCAQTSTLNEHFNASQDNKAVNTKLLVPLPKNFVLEKKYKQQITSLLDFSYTDQFSKETYTQVKKLEKDEFEKFCDFSFKIFQNSTNFFLFDLLNNSSTSTNKKEIQSLLDFYNKNCLQTNYLRKKIETKRNTFHWKWFSLNLPSLNCSIYSTQKKSKTSNFFVLEIPQQAQFFNLKNKKNSLFKLKSKVEKQTFSFAPSNVIVLDFNSRTDKTQVEMHSDKLISSQTPLLNFSKTIFLFNEFERNLNNIFHIVNFPIGLSDNIQQNNRGVNYSIENSNNTIFDSLKTGRDYAQENFMFLKNIELFHSNNKNFHPTLQKQDLKFLNNILSLLELRKENTIGTSFFKTWNSLFLNHVLKLLLFLIEILYKSIKKIH